MMSGLASIYDTPFGIGLNSTVYTNATIGPYYNSTHYPLNLTLYNGPYENSTGSTLTISMGIRVIGPDKDFFCNPMTDSASSYIPQIIGINDTIEGRTVFPYSDIVSTFGVDEIYDDENIPQCVMKIRCLNCDGRVMSIVKIPP